MAAKCDRSVRGRRNPARTSLSAARSDVSSDPVAYNLADLFEHTVDSVADREVLVVGDERRTYGAARGAGQPARPPPDRPGHPARRPHRRLRLEQHRVDRGGAGGLQGARRPGERELPLRRGRAAATCSTTPTSRPSSTTASSRPASAPCATRCRCSHHLIHMDDGSDDRRRPTTSPPSARSTSRTPWPRARPSATSASAATTTTTCSTPAAPPACPRAWCGARRTSSTPSAAASTPTRTSGWRRSGRWPRRPRPSRTRCGRSTCRR